MDVRAYTHQAGARGFGSRSTAQTQQQGTLAHQQKTDLLNASVSFPDAVPPATRGFVNLTLSNDALFISSNDPDHCHEGRNTFGYLVDATLRLNGSIVDSLNACVIGGVPGETEERVLSFMAPTVPDDTEIDLEVSIEFSGSGIDHSSTPGSVVVSSEAPTPTPQCDNHADCPEGQVCKNGACRGCGLLDSLFNSGQCGGSGFEGTINSLIILVALVLLVSVMSD